MVRALLAVSAAMACWAAVLSCASAQTDSRTKIALDDLEAVMSVVSQSVIAGKSCDAGDVTEWILVVSMIDRRYGFCILQDPKWKDLDQGWQREKEETKRRKMFDASIGGYAFIRAMGELSDKIQNGSGLQAFCASMPWKALVTPEIVAPQWREQLVRTNPGINADELLAVFKTIKSWALNLSWTSAPCDKAFFPVTFVRK